MPRIKLYSSFALLAAVAVWGLSTARAQEAQPAAPSHGQINWNENTITVTGSASPNLKAKNAAQARLGAERAAKLAAFRNILEAVKGAKVTGTTTAGAVMEGSDKVKSSVEGVVRGFRVIDTQYYSDGGVDLIVQVPLSAITDALVPEAGKQADASGESDYTGLIINAKGLGVAPALAPRLLTSEGDAVFSASYVQREAIRERGVCGYSASLEDAQKNERIAGKPLVIKAIKLAEKGGADLVISAEDAKKIGGLRPVLAKARVIIVTD